MNIKKVLWGIRSLFYKMTFKKFGNLSYIGTPLILAGVKYVEIGGKVRIFPGLRLEAIGEDSSIIIEDNTSIGQNLHVVSKGNLIIKKNTTISGNVFITNLDHGYQKIGTHIMDQQCIVKDTQIGENCFIGYGAVILPGTVLGNQCVVGANSVVRGTFPDYCVIAGAPARVIKKFNTETKKWERV